jgi:hypothetical protein
MRNRTTKTSGTPGSDRKRNDSLNKSERDAKEKKLPGEYPPQEDIMNRQNMQRVGLDVENFSRAIGVENFNTPDEPRVTDRESILQSPETVGDLQQTPDPETPAARDMEKPVPKNIRLDENEGPEFATGNESDVTQEDLQALGPKDLSMDMGEDEEILKNRVWPVDMAGEDLDVPGTENMSGRDDASSTQDEENDFYSLGGDGHEDNLEGK